MADELLTVIFFSCRRLELLYQAIKAFVKNNSYPVCEYIIVNDSGDDKIHSQLRETYEGATFVFNEENVGLIKSIDLGYKHIKTEYFFHCEDDWCITKGGYIEKSMEIMLNNLMIEEVWPYPMNGHPVDAKTYNINGIGYRLIKDNYEKGKNGYNDFAWHGFTTAIGVKRMSDYRKVGPYGDIPFQGTIWHREQAIGERYHDLGYRSAVMFGEYAANIGIGKSEYVTGMEK
jgi:hypothetical protein